MTCLKEIQTEKCAQNVIASLTTHHTGLLTTTCLLLLTVFVILYGVTVFQLHSVVLVTLWSLFHKAQPDLH